MSDANKTEDDELLEGDRGIPSVTKAKGNGKGANFTLVMVLFLISGVLILWSFWPSGEEDSDKVDLTVKVEDEFDRENIAKMEIPELPDELPVREEAPTQTVTLHEQKPAISQEELARLKKEKDLRERRKRSPLVVYDALKKQKAESQAGGSGGDRSARKNELIEKITSLTKKSTGSRRATNLDTLEARLKTTDVPNVSATYLRDRDSIIAQGKMIGAVIETAISSDLPGMVRAIVSESVYSEDGRTLLVEKGTRLIGEYRAGLVQGQGRIFVIWNRLLTPWGIDVQIGSPGADQLGRSGLSGWIDSHFLERFGTSMLLSIVGAAAAQSNDNQINQELGENFNASAEIALENSINIKPTLHKNQGDKIKIFVARDLNFKPVLSLRSQ